MIHDSVKLDWVKERIACSLPCRGAEETFLVRAVFKDSLSTPCRPVFDGGTNTKPNPDGSVGGRRINELVVKVIPNLVKIMPRFMVGTEACPEQWNLHSVYLRHEL